MESARSDRPEVLRVPLWVMDVARRGVLKVWIDQDLCTGDGICTDHAPEVFTILEDGIAYCLEGGKVFNDPGGSYELAVVPPNREVDVVDAAAECPGECIFIEFDEQAPPELEK